MPISNTESLFKLIKSLTKADKRNFRLYAKRVQGDDSLKFIQLFDAVDKMSDLDESKLIERLDNIKKGQLSNLKRHLYSQILTSLRLISISRIKAIEIREHIDFAHILYSKGLYLQSLKILQRAKKMSEKEELDILTLEIIEFQKVIESRHITNTGPVSNDALTVEASVAIGKIDNSISLSNLRVRLHGYYIRNSHVKNEIEKKEIINYLQANLPNIHERSLGFPENVYLHQCYVWYYYILLDFESCLLSAIQWINVFTRKPELTALDPDLYMRGYHYALTAAFNLKKIKDLKQFLKELESFRKANYSKFNENSKIFSFLYVHWARLNVHFLEGTFDEGVKSLPATFRRINMYKDRVAPHRIMVFYYKIAWMYLGAGDPGKSIQYVSKILNDSSEDFREDIQSYSRLLFLMAHYDLDNMDLLPYLVRTVDAYFKRFPALNRLQNRSLQFFRRVQNIPIHDRTNLLIGFQKDLTSIYKDVYEWRAFLYLDILSWVNAKIERRSMKGMLDIQ